MEQTDLPLPPEIWTATPVAAQALILALLERIWELAARLGQPSVNASRPLSSDPPQTPVRPKAPSGRKRSGPPERRGTYRALVLWRKGGFGLDTVAGRRVAERLLPLIASCRQQGRPLLVFLVAAGEAAAWGSLPQSVLTAPRRG